jgi:hypothetical protein
VLESVLGEFDAAGLYEALGKPRVACGLSWLGVPRRL